MVRSLRVPAALAAVLIVLTLTVHAAAAKTYNHDKVVFFSDQKLGAGDEVKGDLEVVFGNVICEDGAIIDGNVRTVFGNFDQLDGCTVNGRIVDAFDGDQTSFVPFVPTFSPPDVLSENRKVFEKLAWDVVVLFAFLLFPLRVRVALDRVEHHPGLSAAAGTVAAIAVLPIAVMLLLSIIGIPLIVVEIAALFAGLWIGQAAVALLLGRRLYEMVRPHTTPSPLAALVVGLIVVSAAQSLPVVGWAVSALVWLVGLGATILGFFREANFAAPAPSSGPPMRPA